MADIIGDLRNNTLIGTRDFDTIIGDRVGNLIGSERAVTT